MLPSVLLLLLAGESYVNAFAPTTQRYVIKTVSVSSEAMTPLAPPGPLDPFGLEVIHVEQPPLTSLFPPEVRILKKKKGPTVKTWLRRLKTKEDAFSIHKFANLGFVVSATSILGGMLLSPNHEGQLLSQIPSWLAPFDTMFLASSTAQALISIPMIQKFRNKDPEAAATQLGMGLTSVLMATYASWEGPFCPDILEAHWKPIFTLLVLIVASYDHKAAFGKYETIQQQMDDIGVNIWLQTFTGEASSCVLLPITLYRC